ncbi:hypothetical protein ACFPOI_16090 [Nonomuraea angiospora]|uniref:Fibronectin type III-like domain-containing protein n=1 Tax=Nonomuraea angiospora TaxID=46172 RepID=A0ABR9MHA3_9ACTN|nr:hypothetical protein [Nonomuraea angiospora]MBE1592154.1 hypothetical protein [Nonomuraea angiospora]
MRWPPCCWAAEPAYPFGHGLGYTSWDATGLTATSDEVSLTVRNTGKRAGKQVVQVYLSREWKTEPGEFTVHAGFSVTGLPLTTRITGP